MDYAPIVLFAYNRPAHTLRVLEALRANTLANESILYIYCDGPKEDASELDVRAIKQVREVVKSEKWCGRVEVIESDCNLGLSNSIINGVTQVLERYDRVIVLEDDILTDALFLSFMNYALDVLADQDKVLSISSYNFFATSAKIPDTFYLHVIDCWGWATWKRGWNLFERDGSKLLEQIERRGLTDRFNVDGAYDFLGMLRNNVEKKVDSWAIRWYASGIIHNKLSLYPRQSLVQNIGFDGSGVNSGTVHFHPVRSLKNRQLPEINIDVISNNDDAIEGFKKYFHSQNHPSLLQRILHRLIPNYATK